MTGVDEDYLCRHHPTKPFIQQYDLQNKALRKMVDPVRSCKALGWSTGMASDEASGEAGVARCITPHVTVGGNRQGPL